LKNTRCATQNWKKRKQKANSTILRGTYKYDISNFVSILTPAYATQFLKKDITFANSHMPLLEEIDKHVDDEGAAYLQYKRANCNLTVKGIDTILLHQKFQNLLIKRT
jgi:hypothetical protein